MAKSLATKICVCRIQNPRHWWHNNLKYVNIHSKGSAFSVIPKPAYICARATQSSWARSEQGYTGLEMPVFSANINSSNYI